MFFRGEFAFLSNFYPSEITTLDERIWPTVEHAFQAAKTRNKTVQEAIRSLPTPGEAKKAGRRVTLRPDWEQGKLGFMRHLVTLKFTQNEHLREALLATGETKLIEENTWNDTFWGVCGGVGKNHLGKILMMVREELKK